MHLILMTRGIIGQMEEWTALLRAQRFPWKIKDLKKEKEELKMVGGALRPIQFWEYVFPKESLNDVLGAMNIKGEKLRPEVNAPVWMLRKMLKLEPIPKPEKEVPVTGYRPKGELNKGIMPAIAVHDLRVDGVAVYPVGIKHDITKDHHFKLGDGSEVDIFQEGL